MWNTSFQELSRINLKLPLGHEITHGFDDQGRQFDLHGNLVDWWEDDTEEQFGNKAQCIIEQYGNYVDFDSNLKVSHE